MQTLVHYEASDRIAKITIDDGKLNIMNAALLSAIHAAFDRAERERAVVLLSGREGIFSAGFDLKVFSHGSAEDIQTMMKLGADLGARILSFPTPVVVACTGHAYPMGAFLLLAADVRIGADGLFKIGLNEVAIGLAVPQFAIELARLRLAPAYFHRITTGYMVSPREAVGAGFLDSVVAPGDLREAAAEIATDLAKLDLAAHATTKTRIRGEAARALRAVIDQELTLERAAKSVRARSPSSS